MDKYKLLNLNFKYNAKLEDLVDKILSGDVADLTTYDQDAGIGLIFSLDWWDEIKSDDGEILDFYETMNAYYHAFEDMRLRITSHLGYESVKMGTDYDDENFDPDVDDHEEPGYKWEKDGLCLTFWHDDKELPIIIGIHKKMNS